MIQDTEREVLDVVLTITRTKPGLDSKMISLSMMSPSTEIPDVYVEFANIDYYKDLLSLEEFGAAIYNDLHFKQHNSIDSWDQDLNIRFFKGQIHEMISKVRAHIDSIINEHNMNILFWVNDITIWEPFILTFFDKDENGFINMPIEYISTTPVDIGTVFRLPLVSEPGEKNITDPNVAIGVDPELLSNSLSEASFMLSHLQNNKLV